MTVDSALETTLEDHETAFHEVSFLLDVLASTIRSVVGHSTPSLAIRAGRQMAQKLPIYLEDPDLGNVLEALTKHLESGFEITSECDEKGADLLVGHCALRDAAKDRNQELGGDLCVMFHYYVAGLVTELTGRPTRVGEFACGDTCTFRLNAKSK